MTKVNKNLAALGALLFFTFGVIAVSFAAPDPISDRWAPSVKFVAGLKDKGAQADRDALRFGAIFEARVAPNSPQWFAQREFAAGVNLPSRTVLRTTQAPARKVSLHILQSVLIL